MKITKHTEEYVELPAGGFSGELLAGLWGGGPVTATEDLPEVMPGHTTRVIGVGSFDSGLIGPEMCAACVVVTDLGSWWVELPYVHTQDDAVAWLQAQQWGPELMAKFINDDDPSDIEPKYL